MFPFPKSFILNITSWQESDEKSHSCNKVTKPFAASLKYQPTCNKRYEESSILGRQHDATHWSFDTLKTLYTNHTHCLPVSANLVISPTKSLELNYTVLGLRLSLQMSSSPQRPRWIPPDDQLDKSCLNQLLQVLRWECPPSSVHLAFLTIWFVPSLFAG